MAKNIAIKVSNLTKTYKLYARPIDRLKESLNLFGKKYHKEFDAVKDLSFEVKKGETIGIIGRNGCGKSTLLKMITNVLTPTSGRVTVHGKISAILELGAGFNPEMTGLENICLNTSINGFSREETNEIIEEIMAFSELGDFIHQPIKTYSSGMNARLAFALAINVDPDVLIVDEALSVGDIRFQQKSIRKMKDFIEKGKTILFVTHDMGIVNNFCTKVIWLNDGESVVYGETEDVVKRYLSNMTYDMDTQAHRTSKDDSNILSEFSKKSVEWDGVEGCESFGEKGAEITHVALYLYKKNVKVKQLNGGEKVSLFVKLHATSFICMPIVGVNILDRYSNIVYVISSCVDGVELESLNENEDSIIEVVFDFPEIKNGEYSVTIAIANGTLDSHIQHHWVNDALSVILNNSDLVRHTQGLLVSKKSNYFVEKRL